MIELPTIEWKSIDADDGDFVFNYGDYCLRVERMTKKRWWWCVYYKKDYAGFDYPSGETKLESQLLAEICFVRHYLENIKTKDDHVTANK